MKRYLVRVLLLLSLFLCCAFGSAHGEEKGISNIDPAAETTCSITYEKGLVSAELTNIPLIKALRTIEDKSLTAILIVGPGDPLQEKISVKFKNLPLGKAIETVVGKRGDLLFLYDEQKSVTGSTFKLIKIFPKKLPFSGRSTAGSTTAHPYRESAATPKNEEMHLAPDKETEIYFLSNSRSEKDRETLEKMLSDTDPWVRESALRALGKAGGEDSVALIIQALKDADPSVRETAVYALGQRGGKDAIAPITELLKDEDEMVRKMAEYCLKKLNP